MILVKKYCFVILSTFAFVLLGSSCSNQINTWTSRQYQMATTRWNVYFNGKESLRKGQERIAQNHQENFDALLPIYFENNIQARERASEEMEHAVSKAVKAIELHSITAKPKRKKGKRTSEKYRAFRRKKEYNNMIDKCYLLLGKAQFYRREYYSTERTFRYILREYQDMPIHYEAAIYYARTLAEQNKYFRALRTLEDVMAEAEFPKELIPMARAAKADLYIRRGLYAQAIEEINFVKDNTSKSQGQSRYYYILAQLYNMQGEIAKAQATYAELIDTHPDYDYAFHAKLSKALLYGEYALAANDNKVKAELQSLIKDRRNKEYLDQVYYTLARVCEKENSLDKAEENYLLAIAHNKENSKQQAKTLLALGDLYFDKKKDYKQAEQNYRKASELITTDYPEYEQVKARLESLTQLAENLTTVMQQDSLRRIAKLPALEREYFIKEMMLAERKAIDSKGRKKGNALTKSLQALDRPIGEWYFYNPMAVAQGKKEFAKKWGHINLTDNWRTKREPFRLSAEERSKQSKDTLKLRSYEEYLADLPLTEQALQASQEKSINARYDAGVIYEDEMDDYVQAKASFEDVLQRKPESAEKRLRSYYHLYRLNSLLDNEPVAEKYKHIIVQEFADSDLAKLLQDPAYYSKQEQRAKDAEVLYEKAYKVYAAHNFIEAKALTQQGMEQYKGISTYQRFAFLNAMTKAYTASSEAFQDALQNVQNSATDPKILATTRQLLKKLEKGQKPNKNIGNSPKTYTAADFEKPEATVQSPTTIVAQRIEIPKEYTMAANDKHCVAIVLPRDLQANISKAIQQFNKEKFPDKQLRVRRRNFSLNTDIILIESFEGKEDALQYFGQILIAQKEFLKEINEVDYTNLIISEKNLAKLTADREILPYLDFYAYHYFGEGSSPENKQTQPQEKKQLSPNVAIEKLQPTVGYTSNPQGQHSFVLIVPARGADANYLWTALHHFDEQYKVKKEKLGNKRMLVVQGIGTQQEAMQYLKKIVKVAYIYENLKDLEYRNFVITEENLKLLRATKAVDNYIQFFKNNYLTK